MGGITEMANAKQAVKVQQVIKLVDDIDQQIKELRSKLSIVLRSSDQALPVPDESCELNNRLVHILHDLGALYDSIAL